MFYMLLLRISNKLIIGPLKGNNITKHNMKVITLVYLLLGMLHSRFFPLMLWKNSDVQPDYRAKCVSLCSGTLWIFSLQCVKLRLNVETGISSGGPAKSLCRPVEPLVPCPALNPDSVV